MMKKWKNINRKIHKYDEKDDKFKQRNTQILK